jgi:nitrite reductase (NADH) small subunit
MTSLAKESTARRINIGKVDEFPLRKFRIVQVEDRQIGIIRTGDGEIHAVLNRCPHKGAPVCKGIVGGTWPPSAVGELNFDREGHVLTCPWHGFEFDLASGVELFQSRPLRLRKYEVVIEGDSVLLTI